MLLMLMLLCMLAGSLERHSAEDDSGLPLPSCESCPNWLGSTLERGGGGRGGRGKGREEDVASVSGMVMLWNVADV